MEFIVIIILSIFCCLFFTSSFVLVYLLFSKDRNFREEFEKVTEDYQKSLGEIKSNYENFSTEMKNDLLSFFEEERSRDNQIATTNQNLIKVLNEYKKFFIITAETLNEDCYFLRGELARRINSVSDTIPELREFNKGLQTLETHIKAIYSALREMNILEEDEDGQSF